MFDHLPSLIKISAIALGSGWATLAQVQSGTTNDINVYGGWGVAVVGLFTLWRELKNERVKRDEQTERLHIQGEVFNKTVQSFEEEIRKNRESHEIKCMGFQNKNNQ